MILVDSSIWIDHLNHGEPALKIILDRDGAAIHPFVIGEVALGSLRHRERVLETLLELPKAPAAFDDEVLAFIERHQLHGTGIGYVDAHLLTATRLTSGMSLWSRDRRLMAAATRLGIAYLPATP